MPTLSFIVPVYNVEQYLGQCLDSLLSQTFSDWEIIAVNDGSTDTCPTILGEYESRFPEKVRVFHKENGGLSDARNFGLARAKGEFVSFVDADDTLAPDFAARAVEKMQKEDLDLLLFDFYFSYPGKNIYGSAGIDQGRDMKKEALIAPPMAWMRLYRRSLLENCPFEKGIYYEDLEMTPALILRTEKVGYLPCPLYYYRQREGSIMKEKAFSPKFLDIFKVLSSVYTKFDVAGKLAEFYPEIEYLFIEHLCRSAALRFARLDEKKELFATIRKTMEEKFPRWRKNPYLARKSLFFRLVVTLNDKNMLWALSLLAKWKG